MKQPSIYIKTAPIKEQWLAAFQLNAEMEIQLLEDFTKPDFDVENILTFIREYPVEVKILHSPLYRGDDIDFCQIEETFTFEVAKKTCELAQAMAQHYQRPMPVVFHYGGDVTSLLNQPERRDEFLTRLAWLYHQYPDVIFYFENVTVIAFSKTPNQQTRRYRDADPETVPVLVRWLRESFQDDVRFYTVLDTCHALMTERLFQAIGLSVEIESFFKAHQGLCGLIHFANCRHFGFGIDHGTPFKLEDLALVQRLYQYYQLYEFDCPLTLEINEPDYTLYLNYQETFKTLDFFLKKS